MPIAHPASNIPARRHRASPSRLIKLYKHLTRDQRKAIEDVQFGGLLKIASTQIPSDFANWITVECFDPKTSQLVLAGRGRISLTAESASEILGLPNGGHPVKYELDVDAINFISDKYAIVKGTAPKIDAIVERIKANKVANEDFLRSWLMLAVSTFLCPSTGLSISPRCYPSIMDLSSVKNLNWAQFVVDQLKDSASKFDKNNSVKGCVLLLVILYADSLDSGKLQIPTTKPRVAAYTNKLLHGVIKLDTNHNGSFGKLKLKTASNTTVQSSLFTADDVLQFVSSKAPRIMPDQNKRKLCDAVGRVLSSVTEILGNFVQEVGNLDFTTQDEVEPSVRGSKRHRTTPPPPNDDILDEEEDSDYEEESEEEEDFDYVSESEEEDPGAHNIDGDARATPLRMGCRQMDN